MKKLELLLANIYEEIYKIDLFLGKEAFSIQDLFESKKDSRELSETFAKMETILLQLKESRLDNEHAFSKTIIDLHLSFCTITWYFSTLHQNIQKLVTTYPFTDELAHLKKSIAPVSHNTPEYDEETSTEESNDTCFH